MSPSSLNKAQDNALPQGKLNKLSIVELKNGKVIFKQKPISFEKNSETMQGVVKFREYLEKLIENKEPMFTSFPREYMPLIAKLAHESDKTLSALAKYIARELTPAQEDGDEASSQVSVIPVPTIEAAIKSTLERNNYGLDGMSDLKPPASVCVWRWEVKEEYKDWLPKAMREKAETRRAERIQAKDDLRALFEALPQNEQIAIIAPKGIKTSLSGSNVQLTAVVDLTQDDSKSESVKQKGKAKACEEENNKPAKKQSPEKKKGDDPEKTAKERARVEKKAAKDEREKKAKESQNRSRSLMTNFFKPKASTASSSKQSESQTEFERTFKPFVVKKDTTVAPINWFKAGRSRHRTNSTTSEVIVIDEEDAACAENEMDTPMEEGIDLVSMSTQARFESVLKSLTSRANRSPQRKQSLQYKSYSAITIREVMSQLSEAEIAGDDVLVRSLLAKLRDRKQFPAKVLIFSDDLRPGYFGTWTQNSRLIGPRTPLVKDMMIVDYSYDSGEEWEAENPGDADDVMDDAEEDDSDSDDSDLDSWLVDDDDADDPGIPLNLDNGLLFPPELPPQPPTLPAKRKAEDQPGKKKLAKKRKVVVPLVPYSKGPCWEATIGHCESESLKPYRIQLFNDTPFPIDPFTFVSTWTDDYASSSTMIAESSSNELPSSSSLMPPPPTPLVATAKKTASLPKPKTTFPDIHLPFLLTRITSLQAPTITYLVDDLFKELRSQNVKKNAIEAKVREVGERCKEKKYWVVKPSVLASHSHVLNTSVQSS